MGLHSSLLSKPQMNPKPVGLTSLTIPSWMSFAARHPGDRGTHPYRNRAVSRYLCFRKRLGCTPQPCCVDHDVCQPRHHGSPAGCVRLRADPGRAARARMVQADHDWQENCLSCAGVVSYLSQSSARVHICEHLTVILPQYNRTGRRHVV